MGAASRQRILHVGCGGDSLPPWLTGDEVRLDINPAHNPDIVASMTDMGEIGSFDVVYSCHSLEHLYPHDVKRALKEFLRVLRPDGYTVIVVPDLDGVSPTDEVLFDVPGTGGITGRDLIYGYGPALECMPYMAHHTGFVQQTLSEAIEAAGFSRAAVRRVSPYNLLGVGVK